MARKTKKSIARSKAMKKSWAKRRKGKLKTPKKLRGIPTRVTKAAINHVSKLIHADNDAHDAINPLHYEYENDVQVINVIEAFGLSPHKALAVRYLFRAGYKDPGTLQQDYEKGLWCLHREYQRMFGKLPVIEVKAALYIGPVDSLSEKDRIPK